MARRIVKGIVSFISLVPRGANTLPVMYKADDPEAFTFDMLTKIGTDFDEKGELTAVVYAPGLRDSQGDIATADVIKDMAYTFARDGKGVDLRHDEKPLAKEKVWPAESFIIQKGDDRFADMKDYAGKVVDVTGGWAVVLKIDDPELRKQYREGKWNGVSIGGRAQFQIEKSDDAATRVVEQLCKLLGGAAPNGDDDVNATELDAALTKSNTTLLAGITAAFTAAFTKSAEPPKKEGEATPPVAPVAKAAEAPKFVGNPMNLEDVKKHDEALKAFNVLKSVDWNDPVKVAEYRKTLETPNPDGTQPVQKTADQQRVDELEAEIKKIQGRSNQPKGGEPQPAGGNIDNWNGFSKEEDDAGAAMAKFANESRGYKQATA